MTSATRFSARAATEKNRIAIAIIARDSATAGSLQLVPAFVCIR